MEKASDEMDLTEWEILPDAGFLEFHHHEDGEKRRQKGFDDPKYVFNMNHFICPSPIPGEIIKKPENFCVSGVADKFVPVPIQLEPTGMKTPDHEFVKETTKVPVEISIIPSVISEKMKASDMVAMVATEGDQDMVSQVFFKKMKENEFVDMKMDSPKSGSRGIKAQFEANSIQYEEKEEAYKDEAMEHKRCARSRSDQEMAKKRNSCLDSDIKKGRNWKAGVDAGLKIWSCRLKGIGALCSIGVAAATICIFIFGSQQRHKHHQQTQKLQFQIYADEKRIKHMVQQATKLNQALSAVRGASIPRAHITSGGHYEAL